MFMNRNIDKLWLYSEQRNKLLMYATTWVNHKIIIFSERSHIIDTKESILQDLFACNPRTGMLLLLLLLSHFSCVQLCATQQTAAHQAPLSLGSPGKNTGVGCHFLLQCMKVKSESEVTQSCPTLRNPVDYSPPGSSIHGIFQARVLEQGAIAFSRIIP